MSEQSDNDTERSRCADGGSAARVEVVVRKTRIGSLAAIRDTASGSGVRPTTDAERILLVEHKQKVEEILDGLDPESAESGDILGHFEVADGDFEWCPRSEVDR